MHVCWKSIYKSLKLCFIEYWNVSFDVQNMVLQSYRSCFNMHKIIQLIVTEIIDMCYYYKLNKYFYFYDMMMVDYYLCHTHGYVMTINKKCGGTPVIFTSVLLIYFGKSVGHNLISWSQYFHYLFVNTINFQFKLVSESHVSKWRDSYASNVIDEIYLEFSKHVWCVCCQVLDVWAVINWISLLSWLTLWNKINYLAIGGLSR